jgi:UDP-glucose 4-epimerase
MGTLNVVLAFAQHGTGKKKFVFSSTGGAIYGDPKRLPADESTPPHPLSPYALTKQIDEEIIAYYCDEYRIPYTILRYSNVYGPRQNGEGGSGIFPIFINLMRRGTAPIIFGGGKKTRDYIYVEDVAHANLLGLRLGAGETINISSNRETSDDDIFKALAKALRFTKKPRYAPGRKGEVQRMAMSFKKAQRILGWKPKTALNEGVKKTVRSF